MKKQIKHVRKRHKTSLLKSEGMIRPRINFLATFLKFNYSCLFNNLSQSSRIYGISLTVWVGLLSKQLLSEIP